MNGRASTVAGSSGARRPPGAAHTRTLACAHRPALRRFRVGRAGPARVAIPYGFREGMQGREVRRAGPMVASAGPRHEGVPHAEESSRSSPSPTAAPSRGRSRRRSTRPARLAFTYQGERHREGRAQARGVRRLGRRGRLRRARRRPRPRVRRRRRGLGGLDLMVHSIAFAQAHDLQGRLRRHGAGGLPGSRSTSRAAR